MKRYEHVKCNGYGDYSDLLKEISDIIENKHVLAVVAKRNDIVTMVKIVDYSENLDYENRFKARSEDIRLTFITILGETHSYYYQSNLYPYTYHPGYGIFKAEDCTIVIDLK